jgi:hypothetical protein
MATNVKDYLAKIPKARRDAIHARAEELIAEELTLAELREVRQRSQAELAKKLGGARSRAKGDSRSAANEVWQDETRCSRHGPTGNPGSASVSSDRRAQV